ncbi:serine protease [Mesorhizobium sp. M0998]|uniref:trypsin-like serine peptidase n=1 Tax=Mesorhizobium sp. M0998 TaxID=2957044 RepID=UPI0033366B35
MNDHVPPPDQGMTAAQRADIATLLVQNLLPRNIQWLAERVLGGQAISDIIGNRPSAAELASALIERMQQAGRLAEAIAILRTETRNASLLRGLNHILAGNPLARLAALQANVQAPEDPFFNSDFVDLYYPRVQRTVCAVGLGGPVNKLRGTGFLIAPDLVLTNFHVVMEFLAVQSENGEDKITTTALGDQLFFFFDYLSAPRPLVPPDADRPHASVMVRAVTDNWLVRARCNLSNDGSPPYAGEVHKKYDYAVIRLERAVGNVPSRRSGGSLRGWLALDNDISFFDEIGNRLVVLQHPEGAEQLWDVGIYAKQDPSKTRIWYSVNTEKGASGAPAVDRKGRLYALHNASVLDKAGAPLELDPGLRVNQGIRIDVILNDLQQDPAILLPRSLEENIGYWSLAENLNAPRPIIGRQFFRTSVTAMMASNGGRVLSVTGPTDSGRRFSIDLLKRIVGAGVSVVEFGPSDLASLSPRAFVKVLAGLLMLPNSSSIPDAKQTEPTSRWISHDLPTWLAQQLAADQAKTPSRYPVWIVINTVVPDGTRLSWADDLPDLISALMGPPDTSQPTPELPQLRWLLLGALNSPFPPTRMAVINDDLDAATNTDYSADFANCMAIAWRSIESSETIGPAFLTQLGTRYVKLAMKEKKPIRAFLAQWVRDMITPND